MFSIRWKVSLFKILGERDRISLKSMGRYVHYKGFNVPNLMIRFLEQYILPKNMQMPQTFVRELGLAEMGQTLTLCLTLLWIKRHWFDSYPRVLSLLSPSEKLLILTQVKSHTLQGSWHLISTLEYFFFYFRASVSYCEI